MRLLIQGAKLEKVLMTDVNIFSIIICLLILLDVNSKFEKKFRQNNIFIFMLVTTILISIVDSSGWLLNGDPDPNMIFFNYLFNTLLYVLEPILVYLWVMYVLVQCNCSLQENKKKLIALLIPYFIFLILLAINILTKWFFHIDEKGFYNRGPVFIALPALCFGYIAYAYHITIKYCKKVDGKTSFALFLFAVPPIIAGVMQSFFYGVILICPSMTIDLVSLGNGAVIA